MYNGMIHVKICCPVVLSIVLCTCRREDCVRVEDGMLLPKDMDIYSLSWFSANPDPAIFGYDRRLFNAGNTDTR